MEQEAEEIIKSKLAYALLLTLLTDRILSSLQIEDTACKVCKCPKSTYEAKWTVNEILTLKRLSTIQKSWGNSMKQHIEVLLITHFSIFGAEVVDTFSICYILMPLPRGYEPVKIALENELGT